MVGWLVLYMQTPKMDVSSYCSLFSDRSGLRTVLATMRDSERDHGSAASNFLWLNTCLVTLIFQLAVSICIYTLFSSYKKYTSCIMSLCFWIHSRFFLLLLSPECYHFFFLLAYLHSQPGTNLIILNNISCSL